VSASRLLFAVVFCLTAGVHPVLLLAQQAPPIEVVLRVVDETGVVIKGAIITTIDSEKQPLLTVQTDELGRAVLADVPAGRARLRVQKKDFYAVEQEVELEAGREIEIVLNHEQEFVEEVEVIYSTPALDPQKTESSHQMGLEEITKLPFTTTRDIRTSLPFVPGVLRDPAGSLHINGSRSSQILTQIDGFNVGDPGSGTFDARLSSDAIRSLDVQGSRYSAEFGKASGGVLRLLTGMGDDRYRFSATDFLPSLQSRRGIHINNWTPRFTVSGPVKKGRAWFFQALEGEYGLDIVKELPEGNDRNQTTRWSSLTKGQVNLGRSNILSGTMLLNRFDATHAWLSPFRPIDATVRLDSEATLFGIRNQTFLADGLILDVSGGVHETRTQDTPMGPLPFQIQLERRSGNYYKSAYSFSRRLQSAATATLPGLEFHGTHELKFGQQVDHLSYTFSVNRRPILIRREDDSVERLVEFPGAHRGAIDNLEAAFFFQDRWSPVEPLVLELGIRFDWDQLVRDVLLSPRVAASYMLNQKTKLTGGIGLFHDASNCRLLALGDQGSRIDRIADGEGVFQTQIESRFLVERNLLRGPRYLNVSGAVEHQLVNSTVLSAEAIVRRGAGAWSYEPTGSPGTYLLTSQREDDFHSLEISAVRSFKRGNQVSASYTRSSARSSSVIDSDIDNLIFGAGGEGPVAWDVPNRLLSWGWFPLPARFEIAYALDWRSGWAFSVLNQRQELVGSPNSRRFPAYFSLNLHFEKRVRFASYEWALRAGFNNVTNHRNAGSIDANIDSPDFLDLAAIEDRAFVGRVRLLGRK